MNLFRTFCILIFLLSGSFLSCIYGQINTGHELLTLFGQTGTVKQKFSKPLKEANQELDIIVSTGFLIYKKVISSQDVPRCVFTPSCSEYAVEAFKEKGAFTGWLQTFDRLSRCHGFVNNSHYLFDIDKKRFYDPVH
jgi:putative component of membrane protein insertase Oxa1/YidC/SpoIIIJ protein YidD